MPFDRTLGVLQDIRHNIELARSFSAGLTLSIFRADQKTVYAVIIVLDSLSKGQREQGFDG
jgi:uncharacterized protein with HEPN domain